MSVVPAIAPMAAAPIMIITLSPIVIGMAVRPGARNHRCAGEQRNQYKNRKRALHMFLPLITLVTNCKERLARCSVHMFAGR